MPKLLPPLSSLSTLAHSRVVFARDCEMNEKPQRTHLSSRCLMKFRDQVSMIAGGWKTASLCSQLRELRLTSLGFRARERRERYRLGERIKREKSLSSAGKIIAKTANAGTFAGIATSGATLLARRSYVEPVPPSLHVRGVARAELGLDLSPRDSVSPYFCEIYRR